MKRKSLYLSLLAVGLVYVAAGMRSTSGAPTVFFDRDDSTAAMTNSLAKFNEFTATLASYGVDNIETAVGPNPNLTFGSTGITAATQGVVAQPDPGFGIAIDAQSLLELDAAAPGQVNTLFTFSQHITAFGLFVIQGGDGANNSNPTTFRLRDAVANTFVDVPVQVGPDWGFNNVFFLGVTDTVPFNQVEILEAADVNDGMLYDNIVAGMVPEPASLSLVTMLGVCLMARRSRGRRR